MNIQSTNHNKGGRISSALLRNSIDASDEFEGLGANIKRYDLLLLVKRAGKGFGFTPKMINLLDYYMSYTREQDWEEGSNPIIYKSLSRTALDMGVSERQIQRLEEKLFERGALTWKDSGNHRRYGQRCEVTGKIIFGFGVDLTPLALLKEALEGFLQDKRLHDEAWMDAKRQISFYRRNIKGMLNELLEVEDAEACWEEYAEISQQIRATYPLSELRKLLEAHKQLNIKTQDCVNCLINTVKESHISDNNVTYYKYSNNNQSNKLDTSSDEAQVIQGDSNARVENNPKELSQDNSCGIEHITLKQILNVSSERVKAHLPMENRGMNWGDFIEASYKIKGELKISQKSWGRACEHLGRVGASIALILTDRANLREINPVENTAGYFNAMINRKSLGELNLHQSVFGYLKKDTLIHV